METMIRSRFTLRRIQQKKHGRFFAQRQSIISKVRMLKKETTTANVVGLTLNERGCIVVVLD
jgi:hypothetical protein